MIIDIFLIIMLFVVFVLYLDTKKKLKEFQSQLMSNKIHSQPDEFSVGLTLLNGDLSDEVKKDSLTGLPAREAFMDRLQQTFNQSRRFDKTFAVMVFDINNLKYLNEQNSVEFVDKLLREVGSRLNNVIRQIDTVSRYAGGMYVFLLPQLSLPETAAYVAQRVLDEISRPFHVDDKECVITGAIGVSIFPGDGDNEQALIKNATQALMQAKKMGTNRYQFHRQELYALGQKELLMTAFFSRENVTDKMTIAYQPQINVVRNEVVNLQASPCAHIEGLGVLSFREFARIADKCHKTINIGDWLLSQAVTQFKIWHANGFTPINLTIPVTLRQIEQPEFQDHLTKILNDTKFPATQLIFEIVDENVFASPNLGEQTFFAFSNLGISIAISISTLGQFAVQRVTNLPINYLRLNSGLLVRKGPQEENELILKMIISLANDMKIVVVAEEIENIEQKSIFQKLGCEIMQGKYFGDSFLAKK